MKIVLFGPQGVGKGTYGVLLSKKYDLPLLGAGQMLRDAIKQGTDAGKVAEKIIHDGNLVPTSIISDIIRDKISSSPDGYILDGFPRNLEQANVFSDEMDKVDFLIELSAPRDLLLHRLSGRRTCRDCGFVYNIFPDCDPNPQNPDKCDSCGGVLYQRDDDTVDAINRRLDIYFNDTEPVLRKYSDRVIKVDASTDPSDVVSKISFIIEKGSL